jgi:hypothetical protein
MQNKTDPKTGIRKQYLVLVPADLEKAADTIKMQYPSKKKAEDFIQNSGTN